MMFARHDTRHHSHCASGRGSRLCILARRCTRKGNRRPVAVARSGRSDTSSCRSSKISYGRFRPSAYRSDGKLRCVYHSTCGISLLAHDRGGFAVPADTGASGPRGRHRDAPISLSHNAGRLLLAACSYSRSGHMEPLQTGARIGHRSGLATQIWHSAEKIGSAAADPAKSLRSASLRYFAR